MPIIPDSDSCQPDIRILQNRHIWGILDLNSPHMVNVTLSNYRVFIQQGILVLQYNDDILTYDAPKILSTPFYQDQSQSIKKWRKDIEFDFGEGLRATGFAALRETASSSEAGFALFRRNRLIEGSGDETYRPEFIFKKPNSFIYQRLFGELHLDGFDVSHTKDGFKWDENEEPFLELLKDELDSEPLPLLKQAEGYRVRQKTQDLKSGAELSTQRTARTLQEHLAPIIEKQLNEEPEELDPPSEVLPETHVPVTFKRVELNVFGHKWEICIELTNDPAVGDWVDFSEKDQPDSVRQVSIRVSLAHPFMLQFSGLDSSEIEPLLRLAIAIILAQITAREQGVRYADTFRRNINEILREGLSKP